MPPLTQRQLARVSTVLLDEVRAFAPDWTGQNQSDPGITLLELFTFLTEGLLFRESAATPRAARAAMRLARAAAALTGASPSAPGCGVRRVNYFSGQFLGEADFRDEQDYFRSRLRRLNRFLPGSGVVSGLGVSVASGAGGKGHVVKVEPGFAIDPRGEEIEVCEEVSEPLLPVPSGILFVELLYAESPAAPVPSMPPEDGEQFSRVEESFTIRLSPAVSTGGVAISRLMATRGRWRVDRRFKPARAPGSRT